MRSGIKIYVASLLVVGLMLSVFASPSFAAVTAVEDSTWTSWPHTIYYMAHLSGPNSPYDDVEINITAVDEYTLFVNGDEIGSDDDWTTVEKYTVNVSDDDVRIGVEVKNSGTGNGNGLMVDIKAGSDWLGTTTLKRRSAVVGGTRNIYPVRWYYYTGDIKSVSWGGDKWYELSYNSGKKTTLLDDTNIQAQLGQCISGKIDIGQIAYLPDPHIEIITGYMGDVDLGSAENGGIQLRRIDGENIALGKPAQEDKLTDGDPTNTFFAYNQEPLNSRRYVDLERIYRVNRMVLYTGGTNPNEWERKSVRGFAVEISLDKFRWEEVNVIHEIGVTNANEGGYDYASVEFPDEWARYIQFKITEPRQDFPIIGDIMVYGVGYTYDGVYESPWKDFGRANVMKNFDRVEWEGDMPEGTSIKIQTKTAYYDAEGTLIESSWSSEYSTKSFALESPEPASMLKYRVKLSTQDIYKTPVMKEITFAFSEKDQPVSNASGYIVPNKVAMGVDTDFVYSLAYDLDSGQNIKNLVISTPGYGSDVVVHSTDADADYSIDNGGLVDIQNTTPDSLYIEFTNAITDSDNSGPDSLYLSFKSKLLRNIHNFNAWLYNDTGNDGAGGVKVWENRDLGSWTVMTSTIIKGVLSDVKAVPKVFTPNGDNINDFTVIEFNLAKIDAKLKIKIFDSKGSLVTMVYDDKLEPGPWFVPDDQKRGSQAGARKMPGYWDGKDEDGDLVPPGVYLYQVVADTDDGEKVESGSVVIGY
ncbi:MAG: gliding motility-associated C-terminal domain-containing protein [Candidatus Latescibacteria bacterium]|nr:gliding motility-associated C-terminal domain-containing protein [Candidatus Latescibacterota bacterium]